MIPLMPPFYHSIPGVISNNIGKIAVDDILGTDLDNVF